MTGDRSEFGLGARLRAALGNLLLAVLNATLLLLVVAMICGILLVDRVRGLGTEVAAEMSRAAVAATGLDPSAALGELRALRSEVVDLRQALGARREDAAPIAERLEARLDRVETLLAEIGQRRIEVTDRTVDRLSEAAGRLMREVRDCRPAGAVAP